MGLTRNQALDAIYDVLQAKPASLQDLRAAIADTPLAGATLADVATKVTIGDLMDLADAIEQERPAAQADELPPRRQRAAEARRRGYGGRAATQRRE